MRLSGVMDSDQCVAVHALVAERKLELQRLPAVALADHASAGSEHRCQRDRELASEAARAAVWGIEEHEIVLTTVGTCGPEKRRRARGPDLGRHPEGLQVAPNRRDRPRGGVDKRR